MANSKIALIALAGTLAACGSTATAKSPSITLVKPVPVPLICDGPTNPPKTMPATPVADSCWAGSFYLGQGSFHNRKLIFADKSGITALYAITPQLLRTNPIAAATVEQAAVEFVTALGIGTTALTTNTYDALSAWMPSTEAEAKAGDSLQTTTTVNPLGLIDNYPTVLTGGVSDIPTGQPTQTFPVGSSAQVGECVNMQAHVVDSAGIALSNINGYTGWLQWSDQLVKTSSGWKISHIGMGMHERTTAC